MANVRGVPSVYIVDSDASVRRGLLRLMLANGIDARCFASTQQFLDVATSMQYGCIVLDTAMSTTLGVQLSARLVDLKIEFPIIATSVRDDSVAREEAHGFGARFFLTKPVDHHALLDAIAWVSGNLNGPDDRKH